MKKGQKKAQTMFIGVYTDNHLGDIFLAKTVATTPKGAWKLVREYNAYLYAGATIAEMKAANFTVIKYIDTGQPNYINSGNFREALNIVNGKRALAKAKLAEEIKPTVHSSSITTEAKIIMAIAAAIAFVGWMLS